MIGLSFLCSFLVWISCCFIELKENEAVILESVDSKGMLHVLPDDIRIDGNQLQLEGNFFGGELNGKKTVAHYRFTSEKEQQEWEKVRNPILVGYSGTLKPPIGQTNLNGFNYQKSLKEKGIYSTLKVATIYSRQIRKPNFFQFAHLLSVLRKNAIVHCDNFFLKETAQYIKLLLFGYKTSDFSEFSTVLADLGILHLFSLSGMHVIFFVRLFRYLLLRMGISTEAIFWLQLVFSFIYAGLTGYSVSVVRALIQVGITSSNKKFELKLSQLDCWSITLLISMIWNPYILFSAGGQLSYLLSFFILYASPISEQVKNKFVRAFVFSLLLNICTIPIMGLSFFEWQFAGTLFTFLLLPLFEKILLPLLTFSFFTSLVISSKIWIKLLDTFFVCQTSFFHWLSNYFSFKLVIGRFSSYMFILSFLLILLFLYFLGEKSKKVWWILFLLAVLVNQKYLTFKGIVAFIDVGQGDSIFLQAPFHKENILIDTGGKVDFEQEAWAKTASKKRNADYSVIPFLKSRGVQHLDKVFITHGHEDHFGDIVRINEKIPIRSVYYPEGTDKSRSFAEALIILKSRGTKCYTILAPKIINSPFNLSVLAPKSPGLGKNNDSLVIQTSIAKRSFLFTGDLEKEGELELLNRYKNQAIDVLKVGHHGSKTSSTEAFIQNFKPKEAVISCGRDNRFKHPHEETLQTLGKHEIAIFRTDTMGMIYYEWSIIAKMSNPKIVKEQD